MERRKVARISMAANSPLGICSVIDNAEFNKRVDAALNKTLGVKEDQFRKVKDYLYQVKDKKRRVELLERRIGFRRDSMEAHGVQLSSTPKSHNPGHSVIEDGFAEIDELQRQLVKARQELADAPVKVAEFASRLDDTSQEMVILKKYVDMKTWAEIAADMDVSVRWVQKLHGKALPILDGLLREMEEKSVSMNSDGNPDTDSGYGV